MSTGVSTSASRRRSGARDYDRCGERAAGCLNNQNCSITIGKPTGPLPWSEKVASAPSWGVFFRSRARFGGWPLIFGLVDVARVAARLPPRLETWARIGGFAGQRPLRNPPPGGQKGADYVLGSPPLRGDFMGSAAFGGAFRGPAPPDRASPATARVSAHLRKFTYDSLSEVGLWVPCRALLPVGLGKKSTSELLIRQHVGSFRTELLTKEAYSKAKEIPG